MSEKEKKNTEAEELETQPVHEGPEYYAAPPVDIYETDEAIVVEADMPGVDRSGVEVKIDNGLLTVVGAPTRKPVREGRRLYEEFGPVDYRRAFTVGEDIDEGAVSATMEDGVLTVTLPRAARSHARKIEVK